MFRDASKNLVHTATVSVDSATQVTMAAIPGTTTENFPVGLLDYDLELQYSDGLVRTYVQGVVNILEDISHT